MMKAICFLIIILLSTSSYLLGKIRNGYEGDLASARASLKSLNTLLAEDRELALWQRLSIKAQIKNLVSYILYYELTEELLFQLQTISPVVYKEIDGIKDKKGRPTDVYVKLVPKEQARVQLTAASFFEQSPDDEDAHISEYGLHSVSVHVGILDQALLLLFHELGHIKYVIPNLAIYSKFYDRHYQRSGIDYSYVGHNKHDQSGMSAVAFEKRFYTDQESFLKSGGKKPESAPLIIYRIRKNYRHADYASTSRPGTFSAPVKITWE